MNGDDMTSPAVKLEILQQSIEQLTAAGYVYVYIGMDHFAKPDDELAIDHRENKLYRNFQGYSTHSECDLISFGITSIDSVGDSYSQNRRTLKDYPTSLNNNELPTFRGIILNEDDQIRRTVITSLICHFPLVIPTREKELNINFNDYFADVMSQLAKFSQDGLLTYNKHKIKVHPSGHLLIRNICMAFDRYILQNTEQRFSKVI